MIASPANLPRTTEGTILGTFYTHESPASCVTHRTHEPRPSVHTGDMKFFPVHHETGRANRDAAGKAQMSKQNEKAAESTDEAPQVEAVEVEAPEVPEAGQFKVLKGIISPITRNADGSIKVSRDKVTSQVRRFEVLEVLANEDESLTGFSIIRASDASEYRARNEDIVASKTVGGWKSNQQLRVPAAPAEEPAETEAETPAAA